jgi:hypothetical protein
VGLGVGGDGQVALADEFTDSRPRHPAQVHQGNAPVAEIVRAKHRDARSLAGFPYRGAEGIGARFGKQPGLRVGEPPMRQGGLDGLGQHRGQFDP